MNNETNFKNNPLNGVNLKTMLSELVSHYGFDILYAYLNINCFKTNPSLISSAKFLKKTEWAREKVEIFYLYKFKNLPKVSSEQFEIPPRDRIIPDGQVPSEPAELNLEDAERLREHREKKAAERKESGRGRTYGKSRGAKSHTTKSRPTKRDYSTDREPSESTVSPLADGADPWAKWRK